MIYIQLSPVFAFLLGRRRSRHRLNQLTLIKRCLSQRLSKEVSPSHSMTGELCCWLHLQYPFYSHRSNGFTRALHFYTISIACNQTLLLTKLQVEIGSNFDVGLGSCSVCTTPLFPYRFVITQEAKFRHIVDHHILRACTALLCK